MGQQSRRTEELLRPRWLLRSYLIGCRLLLGVLEVGPGTQLGNLLPLSAALDRLGLAFEKMNRLATLF